MAKLLIVLICLTALICLLAPVKAAPAERLESAADADDLSTADSIGVGYYAPAYYSPYYGRRSYGYGGYGGYGYGGYRGYGSYYRRPIYPVWG
ncbi:prismalin-14 [Drosophila montana]|uniref:prismalin-14 n=1 Tax=Drosophila montana TaxID=40370 RepID=UPI00313C4AEB